MTKNNSIWIIDDDPIQIFIAKRLLKNLEVFQTIRTMANPKDALEELEGLSTSKDNLPDVLIVDLNMPQMDGWQFLDEYDGMSLEKRIAIFLVTSSINPADVKRAENCSSVDGYLIKPLKAQDLENALKKYAEN